MDKYKQILLLLILSFVLIGLVIEIKVEIDKEIEVESVINISTPTVNYKSENDMEFIEFTEGEK